MKSFPNVKINLGLHILRKRPDGFHDLETLFVPYDGYTDELEIEPSDSDASMELNGGRWPAEDDLCWKACLLLSGEFSLPPVKIHLTKHSPVGAGLGGGSADAAFTLMMLNSMFALGLSDEQLAVRAAKLGSDCPFFIYNRPMFGEGRGDILTPFDMDLSQFRIELAIPNGVSVSTAEAYSQIRPRENDNSCRANDSARRADDSACIRGCAPSLRDALSLPADLWRDAVVNDFEDSVFRIHPEIAALKEDFYARGAVYASMSGSGSSVFGLFRKSISQ